MTEAELAVIRAVDSRTVEVAAALLRRFFAEEGFTTHDAEVAGNLAATLGEGVGWAAIAQVDDHPVGIATVQLSRSVELGLPAEIGDLWVAPEARGQGIARRLVEACCAWAAAQGSAIIQVTITAEGEARHGLRRFYQRLGFDESGRTLRGRAIMPAAPSLRLANAGDRAAIERLIDEAFGVAQPIAGGLPPATGDYGLRIARAEAWVAEVGPALVGVLAVEGHADHLRIVDLAVAPARQGKGIGRRLIAFAEAEASRRGLGELRLEVDDAMMAAVALFLRHGFVAAGHRSGGRRPRRLTKRLAVVYSAA